LQNASVQRADPGVRAQTVRHSRAGCDAAYAVERRDSGRGFAPATLEQIGSLEARSRWSMEHTHQLLFGRALGQSPQYWLNLQAAYDLKTAEAAMGKQLQAIAELAHV